MNIVCGGSESAVGERGARKDVEIGEVGEGAWLA